MFLVHIHKLFIEHLFHALSGLFLLSSLEVVFLRITKGPRPYCLTKCLPDLTPKAFELDLVEDSQRRHGKREFRKSKILGPKKASSIYDIPQRWGISKELETSKILATYRHRKQRGSSISYLYGAQWPRLLLCLFESCQDTQRWGIHFLCMDSFERSYLWVAVPEKYVEEGSRRHNCMWRSLSLCVSSKVVDEDEMKPERRFA